MIHLFDPLRNVTVLSVAVRMLFAVISGGLIGVERSYKNRPAGFRTHILVCIGAAVASTTGIYLAVNRQFPTDLSRIGAQVVSGLGFIGAGTIIVTGKSKIKGLTTAAGLWVTGITGLAIGAGFYEGAIIAVLFVLIVEILFFNIGSRIRHSPEFHMQVQYTEKAALDHIMRYCKDQHFSIRNLQIRVSFETEEPVYTAVISLLSNKFTTSDVLMEYARHCDGVLSADAVDL